MKKGTRLAAVFALLSLLTFLPSSSGSQTQTQMSGEKQDSSKVVYVCACLRDKSCACMTEAKTEGPCACGTQGGPPLKPVPKDGDWAKQNRDELAK